MMHRKLNFLLIVTLLFVQIASLVHASEYGFDAHKHDGHVCDIYLHVDQVKYQETDSPLVSPATYELLYRVDFDQQRQYSHVVLQHAFARAPPVIS